MQAHPSLYLQLDLAAAGAGQGAIASEDGLVPRLAPGSRLTAKVPSAAVRTVVVRQRDRAGAEALGHFDWQPPRRAAANANAAAANAAEPRR